MRVAFALRLDPTRVAGEDYSTAGPAEMHAVRGTCNFSQPYRLLIGRDINRLSRAFALRRRCFSGRHNPEAEPHLKQLYLQ